VTGKKYTVHGYKGEQMRDQKLTKDFPERTIEYGLPPILENIVPRYRDMAYA
jgi:hypothetical protein